MNAVVVQKPAAVDGDGDPSSAPNSALTPAGLVWNAATDWVRYDDDRGKLIRGQQKELKTTYTDYGVITFHYIVQVTLAERRPGNI